MTNTGQELDVPSGETMLQALAAAANLTITSERLPEITAKYRDLVVQLRELDRLDLSEILPVSGFDPAWESAS